MERKVGDVQMDEINDGKKNMENKNLPMEEIRKKR